ncbi:MAG TPA: glutamate racemase [Candidatus Dormibacteraeota bacterium]
MSDSRPIGVFDSGVGGLTVLREIRRQMPAERLIYVADLEHFPYGPRSQAQVRGLALDIIGMLAGMDTKLVVIACNTATAAALHIARERFDIPVVGVIAPGAQAAAAATRNGRVAVLSTEGTRASGEYVHAIREANPGIVVLSEVAADLVAIVENGDADTSTADAALAPVLERIFDWRADTLVLGCTHYPLLRPALRRVIGARRLRVVDSADTTAARVRRIVAVNRIGADEQPPAGAKTLTTLTALTEVLVTAAPARFRASAARLFDEPLPDPRLARPVPQTMRVVAGS